METVKEKKIPGAKEIEEMMAVYRKLGTPGEPHRKLARIAGTWKTTGKTWAAPGAQPMEMSGTSSQEMILGGRYLLQDENVDMPGYPFTGIAITGFDNRTSRYFTAWIDSMGTGMALFEGTASPDGKIITMENESEDPVRGQVKTRIVTRYIDNDHYDFRMTTVNTDGSEDVMMETSYVRLN